jgi:hypothetical protein
MSNFRGTKRRKNSSNACTVLIYIRSTDPHWRLMIWFLNTGFNIFVTGFLDYVLCELLYFKITRNKLHSCKIFEISKKSALSYFRKNICKNWQFTLSCNNVLTIFVKFFTIKTFFSKTNVVKFAKNVTFSQAFFVLSLYPKSSRSRISFYSWSKSLKFEAIP